MGLGIDATLETGDEVVCVLLEAEGVLSGRLLTASPARILEY